MNRLRLTAAACSAAFISALALPGPASATQGTTTPCGVAPAAGTPTGPLTAAVQSDDFPPAGVPPTHGPNQPGVFHLSGSGGVAPIVCFEYTLGFAANATISADAAGHADLTLAPTPGTPLVVQAVDAAGNVSAPTTYQFDLLPSIPTKLTVSLFLTGPTTDTVNGAVSAAGPNRITNYHFDFGDGTTGNQSVPEFRHKYAAGWWYQITVTVTDSSGATVTATLPNVHATVPSTMTRIAGATRYETGTAVSQQLWADAAGDTSGRRVAHAVVLASGETFPDALAGVPLASYKQGPLLLTEPSQLTDATRREIQRVLPKGGTVYVLGGVNAVSPNVAATLGGDGYRVVRYAGATRYGTALAIAKLGLDDPGHVILATGKDYPDALAAGPAATGALSVDGKPAAILLSDGDTVDDAQTAAYIKTKIGPYQTSGMMNLTTIGYAASAAGLKLVGVDPQEIPNVLHFDTSVYPGTSGSYASEVGSVGYIVGVDRYATAEWAAVYDPGPGRCCAPQDPYMGYASGGGFADALTGGAEMATLHGRLLLTAATYVPAATTALFPGPASQVSYSTYTGQVFGGTQAVSQGVEDQLAQVLEAKEQ